MVKHSTSWRKRASKRSVRAIMASSEQHPIISTTCGCCHPWASRHPCRPPSPCTVNPMGAPGRLPKGPSFFPQGRCLFRPTFPNASVLALRKKHWPNINMVWFLSTSSTTHKKKHLWLQYLHQQSPQKTTSRPFLLHKDFRMRFLVFLLVDVLCCNLSVSGLG